MQRKSFLLATGGALLSSCGGHSGAPEHLHDIRRDGEPLKSAFNRDIDNVRILMLVSPT